MVEFLHTSINDLFAGDSQGARVNSLRCTKVQSQKFEQDIEALNIHNRILIPESHAEDLIPMDSLHIFRILPACSNTLGEHGQSTS